VVKAMSKEFFEPDFIQIPKEVYKSKEIQPIDNKLFGAIHWLEKLRDGVCTASDATLAKIINCSEKTIPNSMKRLIEKRFIIKTGYRQTRKIKTNYKTVWDLSSLNDEVYLRQTTKISSPNNEENKNSNKNNNKDIANESQARQKEVQKDWTQAELSEKINLMLKDKIHLQVIATFFGFKGYGIKGTPIEIQNQKQLSFLIARHSRSASRLAKGYDIEKIESTMQILDQYAPFDWKIESVENYIGRSSAQIIKDLKSIKVK
jgi:hypothetical protein